jgi:hypothetical protein
MSNNTVSNTTISSAERTGGTGRGSATPSPQAGTNTARNRNNRNNRDNRTNGSRHSAASGESTKAQKTSFKGATEGMNGHIFGCFDEQGNKRQYAKTMEALAQYANKTYKFSEDFTSLFHPTPSTPSVTRPTAPTSQDVVDDLIFKEEIKQYVLRCSILKGNLCALWSVTIGQCTQAMKDKLESIKEFDAKRNNNDCIWLFESILGINMQFDQRRYGHLALMEALQKFLTCKQANGQSIDDYRRQLMMWCATIEHFGGTVVGNFELANAQDSNGTTRTTDERKEAARQEVLAMGLLRGSDPTKYGSLLGHLANQYASGRDDYPKDLTTAYSTLVHYRTPSDAKQRTDINNAQPRQTNQTSPNTETPSGGAGAVTLTQGNALAPVGTIAVPTASTTGTLPPPDGPVRTGASLVQYAVMMAQHSYDAIDPWSILLDSQSTISVFNNEALLSNIRSTPQVVRAFTNGGYQDSHMVGDFPNFGPVYYNKSSIANILSLADVRKVCRVTMDTAQSSSLDVHRLDGTVMRFSEHPSGLYVYTHNPSSKRVSVYTLLQI